MILEYNGIFLQAHRRTPQQILITFRLIYLDKIANSGILSKVLLAFAS